MRYYHNRQSSVGPFLLGAMSALAVGGYIFFGSKKAKKNRYKADLWLENAKDEILTRASETSDLTQDKFYEITDSIMSKYWQFKKLGIEKVDEIRENLREQWEEAQAAEDDES